MHLQENEKVYQEVAKLKVLLRENESAMFEENLKLKSRIASLNEEVKEKNAIIRDKVKMFCYGNFMLHLCTFK